MGDLRCHLGTGRQAVDTEPLTQTATESVDTTGIGKPQSVSDAGIAMSAAQQKLVTAAGQKRAASGQ